MSNFAENASLRLVCAILYSWVTVDPNTVTKEDKLAPGDGKFVLTRVKQSRVPFILLYLYIILSIVDLYLGETSAPPAGMPTRLRVLQRIGFATLISGELFRLWAMRTLGTLFTFRLAVRKGHSIVRKGPYAIVRHPSYTGAQIMIAGELLLLLAGNIGQQYLSSEHLSSEILCVLALMPAIMSCIVLIPRIKTEEAMLAENFGDAWIKYTVDVPWRLVPLLY